MTPDQERVLQELVRRQTRWERAYMAFLGCVAAALLLVGWVVEIYPYWWIARQGRP